MSLSSLIVVTNSMQLIADPGHGLNGLPAWRATFLADGGRLWGPNGVNVEPVRMKTNRPR